ncbi:MAG: hypothetical protein ACTSR0_00075 [Candidatus Asgardarchaeia archaeon]
MPRELPKNVSEAIEKAIKEMSNLFKIKEAYLYSSYAKGTWLKRVV